MTESEFSAQLARDGFGEIATRTMAPNLHNAAHSHPFEVRALMLAGELTLSWEDQRRTFSAGEVFTMAAGCEHAEWFGPDGATYLVGRKHSSGT